ATAWRAEDYHGAGALIPDELLDAYMLCGTREDIAARAMAFHTEAGLGLPLLQPVLQEDRQLAELTAAAALYAALPVPATERLPRRAGGRAGARESEVPVVVAPGSRGIPSDPGISSSPGIAAAEQVAAIAGLADDRSLGLADRASRRFGAVWEILRPFAYTASIIPVLAGGAIAAVDRNFSLVPFLAALLGGVLLHSGTNIINEIYDVRKGIDTIISPRASHALLKARLTERQAFAAAIVAFALAVLVGVYLVGLRGPAIIALGLAGLLGGYFYTAPPFEYKYRALGVPIVFLLMGPLMVVGTYFAVTGTWSATALAASVPVGLLVAAILDGNEWRDINEDSRAGISTLSARIGRERAHYFYVALVLGAYITLGLIVAAGWLPPQTLLAIVSLPFLAQVIRSAELGATGQRRAIAMIDVQTARLHLTFGGLLVAGLLLSAVRLHG
ncbi:MAG: prenyltransferase, partial [Candidatus Limnocylindrales bacterium]